MEDRKNILVMGGSFNPPTIAHLKLIQAALDALNADRGYLSRTREPCLPEAQDGSRRQRTSEYTH